MMKNRKNIEKPFMLRYVENEAVNILFITRMTVKACLTSLLAMAIMASLLDFPFCLSLVYVSLHLALIYIRHILISLMRGLICTQYF